MPVLPYARPSTKAQVDDVRYGRHLAGDLAGDLAGTGAHYWGCWPVMSFVFQQGLQGIPTSVIVQKWKQLNLLVTPRVCIYTGG